MDSTLLEYQKQVAQFQMQFGTILILARFSHRGVWHVGFYQ